MSLEYKILECIWDSCKSIGRIPEFIIINIDELHCNFTFNIYFKNAHVVNTETCEMKAIGEFVPENFNSQFRRYYGTANCLLSLCRQSDTGCRFLNGIKVPKDWNVIPWGSKLSVACRKTEPYELHYQETYSISFDGSRTRFKLSERKLLNYSF